MVVIMAKERHSELFIGPAHNRHYWFNPFGTRYWLHLNIECVTINFLSSYNPSISTELRRSWFTVTYMWLKSRGCLTIWGTEIERGISEDFGHRRGFVHRMLPSQIFLLHVSLEERRPLSMFQAQNKPSVCQIERKLIEKRVNREMEIEPAHDYDSSLIR